MNAIGQKHSQVSYLKALNTYIDSCKTIEKKERKKNALTKNDRFLVLCHRKPSLRRSQPQKQPNYIPWKFLRITLVTYAKNALFKNDHGVWIVFFFDPLNLIFLKTSSWINTAPYFPRNYGKVHVYSIAIYSYLDFGATALGLEPSRGVEPAHSKSQL